MIDPMTGYNSEDDLLDELDAREKDQADEAFLLSAEQIVRADGVGRLMQLVTMAVRQVEREGREIA